MASSKNSKTIVTVDDPIIVTEFSLRPHQLRMVRALLDLLTNGRITTSTTNKHPQHTIINSVKFEDPLGSGKTRIILVLIYMLLNSPITAAPPTIYPIDSTGRTVGVVKHYYKHIMRPVVVFVSRAVVNQWQEEIKKIEANFKVFVIDNAIHFKSFEDILDGNHTGNSVNDYDIILVRVGVSSSYSNSDDRSSTNIVEAFGSALQDRGFAARLAVYDDADTSGINKTGMFIPSMFNILVSATKGAPASSIVLFDNLDPIKVIQKTMGIFTALKDPYTMVIKTDPTSIDDSTRIPKYAFYRIKLENPFNALLMTIRCMSTDAARKVLELLNGGAVEAAARALGVNVSSKPSDIFKRILANGYDEYTRAQRGLDIATIILKLAVERNKAAGFRAPTGSHEKYLKMYDKISALVEAYSKDKTMKCTAELLGFISNEDIIPDILLSRLRDLKRIYEQETQETERPLRSMADNIKAAAADNCNICNLDKPEFMTMCCHMVLCSICWKEGLRTFQRQSRHGTGVFLECQCSYCKTVHRDMADSSIRLGADFDLQSLLDFNNNSVQEVEEAPANPEEPAETVDPKLKTLLDIINGNIPQNAEVLNNVDDVLITGYKYIPPPPNPAPRVIVAGSDHNVVERAETLCATNKISFERLSGTSDQISNIAKRFANNEFRVLTIPSNVVCQGLDLQFADILVLMHRLNNASAESQIFGRIQRVGREYSAQIISLVYENELYH